jgi:hypothetical protein
MITTCQTPPLLIYQWIAVLLLTNPAICNAQGSSEIWRLHRLSELPATELAQDIDIPC